VHYKGLLIAMVVIVVVAIAAGYWVMNARISALPQPGPLESGVAMKAKDWYISRAASGSLPTAPTNDAASVSAGGTLFSIGWWGWSGSARSALPGYARMRW
jgi:hypothetical protein